MKFILNVGDKLPELDREKMYSVRADRHMFPAWPVVSGEEVKSKMINLGLYNGLVVTENVEILGPYKNLKGGIINQLK